MNQGPDLQEIADELNRPSGVIADQISLLKDSHENWQPSELIPDLTKENWHEEILELRKNAQNISDEVLIVLIGNMITEEALPSYQTWVNRFEGAKDVTGADPHPWAAWTRAWTAEENRHGDLLNRYLYLSGRVDLRAVEITIQNLLRSGFNPQTDNHPFKGLIYTSFQERATRVSHGNTAKMAKRDGDLLLFKICNVIAADEAKHETAYQKIFEKVLDLNPNMGLICFAEMMKKTVIMPAGLMKDDQDEKLFSHFSIVAQKSGIYTADDYADILGHLLKIWKIPEIKGLSPEGTEAQEKLCSIVQRYKKLASRTQERILRQPKTKFSWVFNQEV